MKYEKKCKAIRLSSNGQVTKTGYNSGRLSSNKLYYYEKGVVGKEAFHIYILAPEGEEIKMGDIFINLNYRDVKETDYDSLSSLKECKKVIASTDSSLNLPRPSNEFLKRYCEEGEIDEVMVEYENIRCTQLGADGYCPLSCIGNSQCRAYTEKLKIAPDNTITIRKVKDTWTREEVETLIYRAISFARDKQLECGELSAFEYDDWLKENL